jgi:OmpA-OmpF porin, OOP family
MEIVMINGSCLRVTLLLAALATGSAAAQTPAQVLKGSQVTEDTLVDALAVDVPPPADVGTTRGFRPQVRTESMRKAATGSGKANLLVTFETNSAELTADGMKILDTLSRALQSDRLAGLSFRVEGHADPRGEAEHNMALSQLRAQSVINYLVTKYGLLPERLTAVGKGATEPLDPKHPEAPENRRVTIATNR